MPNYKKDKSFQPLNTLKPGDSFEFVGLEKQFRGLKLVSITDSCCIVRGESSLDDKELDDNGKSKKVWKNLGSGHAVSGRSEVRKIVA